MQALYPILEFDPSPNAILEPHLIHDKIAIPERCVVCFFADVFETLRANGKLKVIATQRSEIGDNPIYELDLDGRRLAAFHPGVGAPLAAAFLDEVIALGCRKFIACGGAGVLNREIAVGHLVVPTSAVRDEGTSYHYLPPSREVSVSPEGVVAIEAALKADGIDYIVGKTWTTDAIYRETPDKVKLRKEEGCLTVEMEAAAFFAVAQFRGVTFAQILYGGDNLDSEQWDSRHWDKRTSIREKLFWLAAEACLRL
ncbi:MAG: nucleoside phosphorylase [Chloroflexi bacterium]|nr:nucleoside phosphorylase [Chloroflexota bacterium]